MPNRSATEDFGLRAGGTGIRLSGWTEAVGAALVIAAGVASSAGSALEGTSRMGGGGADGDGVAGATLRSDASTVDGGVDGARSATSLYMTMPPHIKPLASAADTALRRALPARDRDAFPHDG